MEETKIVAIPDENTSVIKAKHQAILRAAKALTEAQRFFGTYVRGLRDELGIPADNAEVRWLMTEDATRFFSADANVERDFTKPVDGPEERG